MSINYIIENDYVVIMANGLWDKPAIIKTQGEAAEIVKNNNLKGLIVDLREAEIKVSTLDIYEVNKRLSSVFPLNIKHAVVFDENNLSPSDARFNENVASNHGSIIKMFTDTKEAKNWLKG